MPLGKLEQRNPAWASMAVKIVSLKAEKPSDIRQLIKYQAPWMRSAVGYFVTFVRQPRLRIHEIATLSRDALYRIGRMQYHEDLHWLLVPVFYDILIILRHIAEMLQSLENNVVNDKLDLLQCC